ncbi:MULTISPECIES: CadD family cadmium resistance transporter [Bacillaceae]|mgnify:CR=1 FL=1|uniref:CadD family cadmium resistance transporter n=1 Tax=Bacillaceae TaxID=186817 RepID=UPI0021D7E42A|nr:MULTISPECIES: CadD family cadmium resistance transporter [Bacillaceae]MCU9599862.1 CadD family cadmium resistance transporter [Pallidibacillus thermolactis subsp. kokeshiiformis]MED4475727.1 CadD family cadmium resistance transporter [Oceanobacillus caeni]
MLTTIVSAIVSYIATSIDYIVILVVLFTQMKKRKNGVRDIVLGQYLGFTILIVISLLAAFGLAFIPQQWIGLLGLIPIFIGLKVLFEKDEGDEEDEEILESTNRFSSFILSVTVIMLAAGGDNLGVYIPYFTVLNTIELIVTIVIYYIAAAVLLYLCQRVSAVKGISETVEKYEEIIVPIVFLALGIMIMSENGTFSMILNWFN